MASEGFGFAKQRPQMDPERELKNWKSRSSHLNLREASFSEVLQVHTVSSKYVFDHHIRPSIKHPKSS